MKRTIILCLLFVGVLQYPLNAGNQKIKLLILSGRNNHDWKTTTPALEYNLEKSTLFEVFVTNQPDTLSAKSLTSFDALVSNWNSFPDKEYRWPAKFENALIEFVSKGGGFITVHAATSAFYTWPEFKNLAAGVWTDSTWHGKKCATKVLFKNQKHPITKGLNRFVIFDELWVKAEQNKKFEVLATATNETVTNAGLSNQPILYVRNFGKGRVVHLALGHDQRAINNTGFQALLSRGCEWAATGKVKQKIPQELSTLQNKSANFRFVKNDSTFALKNGDKIVWHYNFNERHKKPHFNPVFIGRSNMTCVSPADHPWHAGQWFSWKYINHVNYWEFVNRHEYRSEGITEIRNIEFFPKNDFSVKIILDIVYHPDGGEDVMAEIRTVNISAPTKNGRITMDYSFEFTALSDSVNIDRTPIEGEPGGQSWGGYGGLSLRFNQSFTGVKTIKSWDGENEHRKNGNWLYMGFNGIDGQKVGAQILVARDSKRDEMAWYVTKTTNQPFYYYGPAVLFYKPITLFKGEKLKLTYRVNHFSGEMTKKQLENEYQNYIKNQ